MNTVSLLAKGGLKANKAKSILIAITIALTTTLLTSVGITCANWMEVNKQTTIERSGSFQGIYRNVDVNKVKITGGNIDLETVGAIRTVGSSEYDENALTIAYVDNNAKEMSNVILTEGNMPTKVNEIAIQDGYLKLLGIEPKVGAKVKLQYESRATDELKEYEFVVSGIMETTEFNVGRKFYSSIISEEFLKTQELTEDMTFSVYIRVKGEEKLSGDDIKAKVKSIANDIGISEYDIKINDDYISATNPDPAVVGGGIVVALIVVFSSVLVIYSIFYVSIITKVQEYGKLRAIGATKKQIKGIILREGIVLASISIPVGLVIGYLISNTIIAKLLFMGKYNVGGFNLPIMLGVLVVSFVTVLISILKPMKVAATVSPVEAIRYNGDDNNNKKERQGYEEITIKRLTTANLIRNKKRTAITLASLGLSGILFITMSTVMNSMDAETMAREHMPGDFTLSLANYTYDEDEVQDTDFNMIQENNPLGKELRDGIMSLPGVNDVITSVSTWFKHSIPSGEQELGRIGGFGEDRIPELEEWLVEGEVNYERLKNGEGVIYTFPNYAEESGIKVGEKVKLTVYDGSKTFEKEFTVEAICYVGGADFIVPNEVINNMIKTDITDSISILVEKDSIKAVEEQLRAVAEENTFVELVTLEEEIEMYELSLAITKTLGYSIVIIIGVIGFMNLINTMITSIITRKKELGMLQAIGMSNKQLVRMLQIEGLFYTGGTLLITLTLGNVVGYIAFLAFRNSGASYATYHYPLVQTIIMIVTITVAQLVLTYLVSSNFNKQSLVDRVRYSE